MDELQKNPQLFIKINEYKNIVSAIETIKSKIEEARAILEEINDLKKEEDAELELWSATLDDAEKKITNLDVALIET